MKLNDLLERMLIKKIEGDPTLEISGLETNSRNVKQGDLFICLSGFTVDGHQFVHEAVSKGAAAVMIEKEVEIPSQVTKVFVPDTRKAMAILSDFFAGQPTHKLKLIGVTGTNGKTTTTNLIEKILNDWGRKTGLIGTIHMRVGEHVEETPNTTPEAIELQRYFKKMIDLGAEYAVLEVSSHALEMGRVRGCNFKTAIFTNLSHDHLDYHQSFERYRDAKGLLFSQLGNTYDDHRKCAVFNFDDETSHWYAKKTTAQIISYGINNKSDIQARDIEIKPNGVSFVVDTFKGSVPLNLQITGIFNVYNSLAAIAGCLVEDVPLAQIKESLENFTGVRGRFEYVHVGQDFNVIVDYAHNPDGLQNVLRTAKEFTKGKLYCIFGCEGDRDREKRPVMANVAVRHSDYAILTSDNTRSEDPDVILREMKEGLLSKNIPRDRYSIIANRRQAISQAINRALRDDCIIIAGKGHETHQIIEGNKKIPFDDKQVAIEFINNRLKNDLQAGR